MRQIPQRLDGLGARFQRPSHTGRASTGICVSIATCALLAIFSQSSQAAVEVFVSPAGDDGASGAREQPLRTLRAARDRARAARADGDGGATIWLLKGRYALGETLTLEAADSGTP